jgi:hypothetical protein
MARSVSAVALRATIRGPFDAVYGSRVTTASPAIEPAVLLDQEPVGEGILEPMNPGRCVHLDHDRDLTRRCESKPPRPAPSYRAATLRKTSLRLAFVSSRGSISFSALIQRTSLIRSPSISMPVMSPSP